MFVAIFKATINTLDEEYSQTAERMRELAIKEFGCLEFSVCAEGDKEIAVSYWPSRAHIEAWHKNPEHQKAQILGKSRWYSSYEVTVMEVLR